MNYIKQLQQENAELKANRDYTERQITYLLTYLSSDKFQGIENNYVNAKEMFTQLLLLRSNLNTTDKVPPGESDPRD